jgi:hypothetical protein
MTPIFIFSSRSFASRFIDPLRSATLSAGLALDEKLNNLFGQGHFEPH